MANEIIGDQQSTSEDSQVDQVSPQPGDQITNVEDGTQIPEKFVGKSLDDVLGEYKKVESYAGRMASEKAESEEKRQALEERIRELENSQYSQPENSQSQRTEEPEADPFDDFDSRWETDPKEAIRNLAKATSEKATAETQKQANARRAQEANEYYYKQKEENPDYARREKLMERVIQEYGDVINPSMIKSVKGLKLLDIASKGLDTKYYESQAIERSRKDGLSVKQEKRDAQSESTSSEGDRSVDFNKLSLKEMEALLGRADD